MPTPTGHWLCRLDGYPDLDTDRLRLREVVVAEELTGLPYRLLDPSLSGKVAVALFALMLIRSGVSEDDAAAAAGEVELAQLHGAFQWVEHQAITIPEQAGVNDDSPPSSAATSPAG